MLRRFMPPLMICLLVASAAHAQYGGGGGIGGGMGGGMGGSMGGGGMGDDDDGGGGRRHGGGGRGGHSSEDSAPPDAPPPKPFAEPEIIGVVKTIDLATGRVTIAYEPVEALGWPAGTQPFSASKTSLLKDVTVGEKVRFKLESQQIAAIRPF